MEIDFYKVRPISKGRAEGFEELCCQIFFREFNSDNNVYSRFRGDGGDGGVEALFNISNGNKIALQSKYWEDCKLGTSQIDQLSKSIKTAKTNHPEIIKYYISIPFNLTGKVSGGNRGKSQTDKFDEWKVKKENEFSVEIILWSQTRLSELIIKHDESGGFRKYWFDTTVLTDEHYTQHIQQAIAQAGKRYTPKLSIKVPILNAFEAFVKPENLFEDIIKYITPLEKKLKSRSFKDVLSQFFKQSNVFNTIIDSSYKLTKLSCGIEKHHIELLDLVQTNLDRLVKIEEDLLLSLKKLHGDKFNDTPGYRQFMAEYMCAFPTAKLDSTRDMIVIFRDLYSWLNGISVKLHFSRKMLVTGIAGIGKTHSIIDFVKKENRQGLYVFFGEDFNDEEPWKVIRDKLGFSGVITRAQLFNMLSVQAVANAEPTVIFIDALNESKNRKNWRKWLPTLIEQILCYNSIKICVSCRSVYLDDVFENKEGWVEFSHNGFLGQEYLAIQEFFKFYKLNPPVVPLLQNEFRNPLFLHLVCGSLKGENYCELPKGRLGFQDTLSICICYKNRIISEKCDSDPNSNIVQKALSKIAERMIAKNTRFLSYEDVKEITDSLHKGIGFETSLINNLEKEGLLSFVDQKVRALDITNKLCRFTFERIADFFIANYLIETNKKQSDLMKLLNSVWLKENRGVIEALAIILPETDYHSEIVDYTCSENDELLTSVFISSLQWRNPDFITSSTRNSFEYQMSKNRSLTPIALNSLISISIIPDISLNAMYLDEYLNRFNMCERDPMWTDYLIDDYEKKDSAWMLIEWANFSNLSGYNRDTLLLWAITLSWFLTCSDRIIRDRSSKGLTQILFTDIKNCLPLLSHFKNIDDDYILERVTLAIYSALLLKNDNNTLNELVCEIINRRYLNQFDNIIIYDNLRLIIELAFAKKVKLSIEIDIDSVRRTCSNTKFKIYSDTTSDKLLESDAFSNSHVKMVGNGGMYTDFQRYILDSKIRVFDLKSENIKMEDIYRWFLCELEVIGYPGHAEYCWEFDRYLLGKHGGGRAKPVHVERLGKKYYWILLHRLIGILRNTVPYKPTEYLDEKEPLHPRILSLPLRKIDLTDLRYKVEKQYPEINQPKRSVKMHDNSKDWLLGNDDFYDIPSIITNSYENDIKWIPLLYLDDIKSAEGGKKYPSREKTVLFTSYIISKCELHNCDLKNTYQIDDGVFDSLIQDYRVFLGEYPNTIVCDEKYESGSWTNEYDLFGKDLLLEKTAIEFLRGREWQYDCSYESSNCYLPSKSIISLLGLQWDCFDGWIDNNNDLAMFSMKINGDALWIKNDFLLKLLGKDRALLYVGYNEKMYVTKEMAPAKGMNSKREIYIYDGKNIGLAHSITQDHFYNS